MKPMIIGEKFPTRDGWWKIPSLDTSKCWCGLEIEISFWAKSQEVHLFLAGQTFVIVWEMCFYWFIYSLMYLSIYLSFNLFIYLFIYLFRYSFRYLFVYVFIYLFHYMHTCQLVDWWVFQACDSPSIINRHECLWWLQHNPGHLSTKMHTTLRKSGFWKRKLAKCVNQHFPKVKKTSKHHES